MAQKNLELIRQSLSAAEASIKLAKQMLGDLEKGKTAVEKAKVDDTPGIIGIFDGENMTSSDGKVFPVPSNYASKSMLVAGDTLKLIEEGKEKRFKQVEHVKRQKTLGVLAKKDGKWKVVAPEGSYKVLPASVSHFGVDVGSEVVLQLPAGNLTVGWGAIEAVKTANTKLEEPEEETVAPAVAPQRTASSAPVAEVKKETVVKKPAAKPVAKVEAPKVEQKVEAPKPEQPKEEKQVPPVVEVAKPAPAAAPPSPAPVVEPSMPAPEVANTPEETPAPASTEDELI